MKITVEELEFTYTFDWDKTGTEDENYSPSAEEAIDVALRLLVPFFGPGEIRKALEGGCVFPRDYE